jgi:hypothetical protein
MGSLLMFAMVGLAPLSYIATDALVQVSLAVTFGVAGLLMLNNSSRGGEGRINSVYLSFPLADRQLFREADEYGPRSR